MEDKSDTVNLQLRVGNNIYKATVSSNAVTEILINKEKSEIVQIITQGTTESMVVGKFKEYVEIMSVSSVNTCGQRPNADEVMDEVIEVEVGIHISHRSNFKSYLLCIFRLLQLMQLVIIFCIVSSCYVDCVSFSVYR